MLPTNKEFTSYGPTGVILGCKEKPGVQLPVLSDAEILVKVRVRCCYSELLRTDWVTRATPRSLQDQHGLSTACSPLDPSA